jgi:hypothetical protein
MNKQVAIILGTFFLTVVAGLIYSVYLFRTVQESATLGIPFAFVVLTGLLLFVESVVFAVLFYKHLATTWPILLPIFLVTSVIPIYFGYHWYSNRPVEIPVPGQLPVSANQYEADNKLIIDDYLQTELDSNSMNRYQDTIQSAFIDTIFYSPDKTQFFAIIISVANDNEKVKYCANYRVGKLASDKWQLGKPKGNVWSACFQSIEQLKLELRHYYYKNYALNKSSNKPEIWTDNSIFNFENNATK